MLARRWSLAVSPDLRGARVLSPWIIPWFVIGALILGISGARDRGPTEWLYLGLGLAVVLALTLSGWLMLKGRPPTRAGTTIALTTMGASTIAGAVVTVIASPDALFLGDGASLSPLVKVFLIACLALVWFVTWLLFAILVAGQTSYRSSRRVLGETLARIGASEASSDSEVEAAMSQVREASLGTLTRVIAELDVVRTESPGKRPSRLSDILDSIRNQVVEPVMGALATRAPVSSTPLVSPPPSHARPQRLRVHGISRRWNGVYF